MDRVDSAQTEPVKTPKAAARDDFRDEFARVWAQLPDKGMFLGLLFVWLAIFQFLGNSTFGYTDTASLFRWLYVAYNAPGSDDGHGNLIPFAVLGLLWWKRAELQAVAKQNWWPALLLLGVCMLLHVAGYLFQQPRLSVVALFVGIYALTGLVWGWRWMSTSFFPMVLLAFCMPVGSQAERITFPLRMLVTSISAWLSQHVLGIDVVRDGTRLMDPGSLFQYDVAAACSGIRSLTALLAFTTIYAFTTFKPAWKRLFFVLLAVPLAVIGNVVRITVVIVAAKTWGENAGKVTHDWFGFITFAVAIVCVMALGWWLRDDKRRRSESTPAPQPA